MQEITEKLKEILPHLDSAVIIVKAKNLKESHVYLHGQREVMYSNIRSAMNNCEPVSAILGKAVTDHQVEAILDKWKNERQQKSMMAINGKGEA